MRGVGAGWWLAVRALSAAADTRGGIGADGWARRGLLRHAPCPSAPRRGLVLGSRGRGRRRHDEAAVVGIWGEDCVIADEMASRAQHQGRQARQEVERFEQALGGGVAKRALELMDHQAVARLQSRSVARKTCPPSMPMLAQQLIRFAQPEAAPKGCGTRMCRMKSIGRRGFASCAQSTSAFPKTLDHSPGVPIREIRAIR